MLTTLRDSMRVISESIAEVTSTAMSGPVRIASPGSFMPIFVLPALRLLKQRYPQLRPVLEWVMPAEIAHHLVTGTLDLVLTDQSVQLSDELVADLLFKVTYGVYCGDGHPLYDRAGGDIDPAALEEYEFVAPPGMADHWPAHVERKIGILTTILSTGVELCGRGDFLAVLPDVVAQLPHHFAPLRRLPFETCTPVPMYAIRRRSLAEPSATEAAVTAIRETIETSALDRGKADGHAWSGSR
ncbi:MAG: substrate-binding domain-containing protein [Proteobacteria bacterium]|nr:substrate-binding domain-containing protein [Pseudomonadota bacterium]